MKKEKIINEKFKDNYLSIINLYSNNNIKEQVEIATYETKNFFISILFEWSTAEERLHIDQPVFEVTYTHKKYDSTCLYLGVSNEDIDLDNPDFWEIINTPEKLTALVKADFDLVLEDLDSSFRGFN